MDISKSQLRWLAGGLFLLALILRLYVGVTQLQKGLLFVSEGDYNLYQIGAEHFLEYGNFDNSLFLIRPPLFPLIVAVMQDNHLMIILLNAVLGALLSPLAMIVSIQIGLPRIAGVLAGVLLACDTFHIRYTAFLGPEALSFVSALAMMSALIALHNAENRRMSLLWGIVAGIMLLISAYSRPAIYLIWTGLSVWLLLARPRYWFAIATFAIISVAGTQIWSHHNALTFGNRSFSTVSAYTMTYYRAAAVLNQANPGMPIDEVYLEIGQRVEEKLGRDPSLVDEATQHSYLAASPEVEDALNETSLEIFTSHPEWYLITLGYGTVRYFNLLPPVPPLSNLTVFKFYPPVIYTWILLLSATFGLWQCWRQRNWLAIWGTILMSGYFTVGTLLVKSAGISARERGVIIPLIAILAGYGMVELVRLWRERPSSS